MPSCCIQLEQENACLKREIAYLKREIADLKLRVAITSDDVLEGECPICVGTMRDAARPGSITMCGHIFHGCCLKEWLMIRPSCPICRGRITKYYTVDVGFHKKRFPHHNRLSTLSQALSSVSKAMWRNVTSSG